MKMTMCLLPPSPVSSCVPVDVRMAVESMSAHRYELRINGELLTSGEWRNGREEWRFECFRFIPEAFAGENSLELRIRDASGAELGRLTRSLTVVKSSARSTGLIDGAWCGLYHWSEAEGRLWNRELARFTADDWRELVRGMHGIGMNVIVLQELFRNDKYFGKHDIPREGYQGRAFYPTKLGAGPMPVACSDPVEAILDEADRLDMTILPGIGMYAFFDYTPASLEWHVAVAREIYGRYGHHRSFYGFYISEEVFGNLDYGPRTGDDIVDFFRLFRQERDRLNPALPVMLAPNCFDVPAALPAWRKLAAELDIICPFGFHRMPETDIGPTAAIELFQEIADDGGAHLWLDMEAFLFHADQALYPRPIAEIAAELADFRSFEKILCYQYPGIFNAPDSRRKPGGDDTVQLYLDYQKLYHQIRKG